MTTPTIDALPAILREKIRPNAVTGCWEWTASLRRGYGQVHWRGKNWLAHRLTYTLLVGNIPGGLQTDHLCRFTRCVNPAHLEPVTNLENARRGVSSQWRKTHCPSGHPYDEANTKIHHGHRYCIACQRGGRSFDRIGVRAPGGDTCDGSNADWVSVAGDPVCGTCHLPPSRLRIKRPTWQAGRWTGQVPRHAQRVEAER